MDRKTVDRLRKLFGLLGSDNEGERNNAMKKIKAALTQHKKTWNDLLELVSTAPDVKPASDDLDPDVKRASTPALDLVMETLKAHVDLKPHEFTPVALWILHAHVFESFMITPRLALLSPVRGCGKTTVLNLIRALVPRPLKTDHTSPAAIYRFLDEAQCTFLIDEGDNLEIGTNALLRSVLNSGHERNGAITRVIDGVPTRLSTFAPMAIAAIGRLSLPLMQRSIVIEMERSKRDDLKRMIEPDVLRGVFQQIRLWQKTVKLNSDPELPPELRNRAADNWRPLIAIADSFGSKWGAAARETAVAFSRTYQDEDLSVTLLHDIRKLFATQRVDRFASTALVAALIAMEDTPWSEWRGASDNQQPRRLTQSTLAQILRPFRIKSRTVRLSGGTSRGYLRAQFEQAWESYCSDTATESNNIKHLNRPAG